MRFPDGLTPATDMPHALQRSIADAIEANADALLVTSALLYGTGSVSIDRVATTAHTAVDFVVERTRAAQDGRKPPKRSE